MDVDADTRGGGLTAAELRRRVLGDAVAAHTEGEQDPILGPYYALSIEHAYGGVWSRPDLGLKERSLVTVAALVALGRAVRLARHLEGALNTGWTPVELREACLHLVAYAGFPAAGDALQSLSEVVRRRGDVVGPPTEAETVGLTPAEVRRRVLGAAWVDRTGREEDPILAPIWSYSIEHAWGAVWVRPGLSLKQRSLITVSALTALARRDELRLHLRGGLNTGWTPVELREICLHVAAYAGVPTAITALHVLSEVVREREGQEGPAGSR